MPHLLLGEVSGTPDILMAPFGEVLADTFSLRCRATILARQVGCSIVQLVLCEAVPVIPSLVVRSWVSQSSHLEKGT